MRYPCPVCGYSAFTTPPGGYEICPICDWEDDQIQFRDRNYQGGANKESLNEAKENWKNNKIPVCLLTQDEGGIEYVYARLANDLNFPDYFGKNADALDECLGEIQKATIVWNDSSLAKEKLGGDFTKITKTIERITKENPAIKLVLN